MSLNSLCNVFQLMQINRPSSQKQIIFVLSNLLIFDLFLIKLALVHTSKLIFLTRFQLC